MLTHASKKRIESLKVFYPYFPGKPVHASKKRIERVDTGGSSEGAWEPPCI